MEIKKIIRNIQMRRTSVLIFVIGVCSACLLIISLFLWSLKVSHVETENGVVVSYGYEYPYRFPVSILLFFLAEALLIVGISVGCFKCVYFLKKNRHSVLSSILKIDKTTLASLVFGIILITSTLGLSRLYVWTMERDAVSGGSSPEWNPNAILDAPDTLDNGTHVNQLIIITANQGSYGNIFNLSFYIKKENDTNWTKLNPSNDYTSGQIVLENVNMDNRWDVGESVTLSEPTPDWMTKVGVLNIKIIHAPSNSTMYDDSHVGGTYVS